MLASMPPHDSIVKAATHFLGSSGKRIRPSAHSSWMLGVWVGIGTFVSMALTLLQADYCRKTNWVSPGQFVHVCYSDIPTTTLGAKLTEFAFPWTTSFATSMNGAAMKQPPGTSALMWMAAQILPKPSEDGVTTPVLSPVYDLSALIIAAALAVMGLCVLKMRNGSLADASLVVLSPVIIAASMISFDMVGVALAVAGVAAVFAGRQVIAGLCWFVAALITVPMILVPLAALALGLNAAKKYAYTIASAIALGAFACFHLVWSRVAPVPFAASWEPWVNASIGYGSLMKGWAGWVSAQGQPANLPESSQASIMAWVVLALCWIAVGTWAATAKKAPHLPLVILLMMVPVTAFWLAVPVQASLWLLPWVALSVRRWNIMLFWGIAEVIYAVVTWQHLYAGASMPQDSKVRKAAYGANAELYAAATFLRVFAMAAVAWVAWRWRHDADFKPEVTDCWPETPDAKNQPELCTK